NVSVRSRIAGHSWPPFDFERSRAAKAAEGQGYARGRRDYARRIPEALERGLKEGDLFCARVVLMVRQRESGGGQTVRAEADVDFLEFRQALQENSRAGQQHERERKLADDEDIAEAVARAAATCVAAAL